MFEDRTQENIKAEALALLSPAAGVSALAGSYADATLGAVAGQLSELYQVLPAVVSMLFVDEYSGPYIDLVGSTYFNLPRRPGTKARCDLTLNGDAGTTLPAGTVFLTRSGLEFLLLDAVTIPQGGTAEGTLEAAETGAAYNVGEGEINRMYINAVGLSSYTNGEAQGGTDAESDAALLARIRERREKPANGANGWQYRQWALSVAGVGDAKVVELSDGPGTVGVTIVDSSMAPASPEIVEAVQTELDENRPVGASVAVAAPGSVELAVSAVVVITAATTAQAVKEAFSARLRDYIEEIIRAKYGTIYYGPEEDGPYTVIYNRILALLLTIDGVENAASLTINGGTDDVTIQADEVPALGTVEVTV